ncbi:MAG: hypothetical protein Q9160_003257 [Pyrenula sp. 1 TL-2023]
MDSNNPKRAAISASSTPVSSHDAADAPARPGSSAVSMHTLPEYSDVDEDIPNTDDLPAYTDVEEGGTAISWRQSETQNRTLGERLVANNFLVPGARRVRYRTHRINNPFKANHSDSEKCLSVSFVPELSTDPDALNMLVVKQALQPPNPYIRIKGTHTRSTRDSQGKESKDTVIDFNFGIEAGDTITRGEDEHLFPDPSLPYEVGPTWRILHLPGPNDKAYRGTRTKSAATPFKSASTDDPYPIPNLTSDPSDLRSALSYWCSRFTTDPSSLKSFTFTRTLEHFDSARVQNAITAHIRSLNYRGTITVETHIENAGFTVYSPHWINKLRVNSFVWYLCAILQLWIITWPVIWLMEKRYEVVSCKWYFAHHVTSSGFRELARGYDEEGWVRMWGKAIRKAAEWRRRDGEYLTREDLQLVEAVREQGELVGEEERARRERSARGEGGWMDSAVGLVRGIGEASREYNRAAGWGMDE